MGRQRAEEKRFDATGISVTNGKSLHNSFPAVGVLPSDLQAPDNQRKRGRRSSGVH